MATVAPVHTTSRATALLLLTAFLALGGCDRVDPDRATAPDAEFARGGKKNPGGGPDADLQRIGGMLFADASLSVNGEQSCQSCHEPSQGFANALPGTPLLGAAVQGAVPGRFGDRKPPSAAYATLAGARKLSGNGAEGGLFWDGRATGESLGDPAAEQALGPFVNPLEQAMPYEGCVVWRVGLADYGAEFAAYWNLDLSSIVWPADVASVCTDVTASLPLELNEADEATVSVAYEAVARSIAAFETTFNVFDSRFDRGELTPTEAAGEKLFGSKGKCQQCHDDKGGAPLFTDFAYHNLGVPAHPENPWDGAPGFDPGLGGSTGDPAHLGKFKTPTVRNVDMGTDRTYMHNGVLRSLRQVVDFYNTRDVTRTCTPEELATLEPGQYGNYAPDDGSGLPAAGCWPPPEYPENLDTRNMGNLGLTDAEVDAIVAFMRALTDGR